MILGSLTAEQQRAVLDAAVKLASTQELATIALEQLSKLSGIPAFDIVRQAPPMQEWSPYRDVNPPHLDGYFRATHGEFRLVALPGGRTRLEGRTSYEVGMFPQGYWAVAGGRIVSAIHLRVLRHIKRLAEGDSP